MIHIDYCLRHAVVIGILCLESEFKIRALHCPCPGGKTAQSSTIGPYPEQLLAAIRNQAQRYVIAREGKQRRAKHCSYKFIVKKGRAKRELTLFQRKKSVVMPGRLAKH